MYQPTGDTVVSRPAIVWVHGGSFCWSNCSGAIPEVAADAQTAVRFLRANAAS
jgi:hypothetical protein